MWRATAGLLVQQVQRVAKRPPETTLILAMATRAALDTVPDADREAVKREVLIELGL